MEGHSTEIHRTIFREVIDLPHIKPRSRIKEIESLLTRALLTYDLEPLNRYRS